MAPHGQPAFILYVQTFGDLVTFNPHIHALVAEGVFLPSGTFRVLPPVSEQTLCQALRLKLLDFLCAEGVLDAGLARYMIRCPFALNKMSFDQNSGTVIYRSKPHATLKRNYQLMPALKWLRLLLNHVPNKYEHLVRSRLLF